MVGKWNFLMLNKQQIRHLIVAESISSIFNYMKTLKIRINLREHNRLHRNNTKFLKHFTWNWNRFGGKKNYDVKYIHKLLKKLSKSSNKLLLRITPEERQLMTGFWLRNNLHSHLAFVFFCRWTYKFDWECKLFQSFLSFSK